MEKNILSNNMDDGLITKIWGPPMWISLHSITFCYPENPTYEVKKRYENFFRCLQYVLPCKVCKDSYGEFIKTGITVLNDTVFENRTSLTKWLYYIHEAVNKKLGVDYGVSYEDVVKRYESYRAACPKTNSTGCEIPVLTKNIPYIKAHIKDCPIIPVKMAKQFVQYAKLRGLAENDTYVLKKFTNGEINKDDPVWIKRNKECDEIINNMREEGIMAIETEGEWSEYPTISETRLILRLCSTLSKDKLIELISKLPNCGYSKIYKLTAS